MPAASPRDSNWWRTAVIYQVYIRSFADSDGDGIGDIDGIRSRLPYLADLGVDAIWINPWYPSPMADGGYDISDYRSIDPVYGSLQSATALLDEAYRYGIRVLLDLVPNHTSDQHRWFDRALRSDPDTPERARYIFQNGRTGPDGTANALPPNDWQSQFGGPAWTRIIEPDGATTQWYLHRFSPHQPEVNWFNADVEREFLDSLRFWFDLGVDGFRIDVAHSLITEDGTPDVGSLTSPLDSPAFDDPDPAHSDPANPEPDRPDHGRAHPHQDRDEMHEVYRTWRRVADSYPEPKVLIAESWVEHPEQLALYVRPDELHSAFNFSLLRAPWTAEDLCHAIDSTLGTGDRSGSDADTDAADDPPPTWVLSNHDTVRHVSRFARDPAAGLGRHLSDLQDQPADLDLGRRRARAAILLELALPGSVYLYQGEELGLPEVEDLDADARRDPIHRQSGRTNPGRDGCRVPLPWAGVAPPYAFSPDETVPWLPQPADWAGLTVAAESGDPSSMLELYRSALQLRRSIPALGRNTRTGTLRWLDAPTGALRFGRDPGFVCTVNVSADPFPVGTGRVLLSSGPLRYGRLPLDTAVWTQS